MRKYWVRLVLGVVFGASNVSFVWESKTLTSRMENKSAQVAEMSDVSAGGSRSDWVYELKAHLEAGTDRTLDDWLPRADHQLNAAGLLFIGNVQVVEQVVSFPFSFQFFTRLAAEANVPDPKGRHGKCPCRAQLLHCLVAGRTPLGERIWDMQRLLDWVCKLPQVDPQRILMTGNSGGGVLTAYTAAIDKRVTVAIPSCSFTSLTSQEGFLFHCDCCLVPGLRDWGDWKEIGGLIAPRHLLIVHGRKDGLHHHNNFERTAQ